MPTTNFIPIYEVKPPAQGHYKTVNKLSDLSWKVPKDGFEKSSALKIKKSMDSKIETQTLYFTDLESGVSGFIQILYSHVLGGFYRGFQLNFKIFSHKKDVASDFEIWETYKLNDMEFVKSASKSENYVYLGAKGKKTSIAFTKNPKKKTNKKYYANLDIDIEIPKKDLIIHLQAFLGDGFMISPSGCSYYLDKEINYKEDNLSDIKRSGRTSEKYMRHLFMPNGYVEGHIEYTKGDDLLEINLVKVPVVYIDAVQGLLPNKAARMWNFLCFKSKSYTVTLMEFITTEEYGSVTVSIWSISENDKLTSIGSQIDNDRIVRYKEVDVDKETGWEYPTTVKFDFMNGDKMKIKNMNMVNRFDILGELPSAVRKAAQSIANIKPYLYQYCQEAEFRGEKGTSIVEATFIS